MAGALRSLPAEAEEVVGVPHPPVFERVRHVQYCAALLQHGLPAQYQAFDLNRMVLAYFAVAGLDVLGHPLSSEERHNLIEAVYSLQVTAGDAAATPRRGGFRPSPIAVASAPGASGSPSCHDADVGHLTMSQTALLTLMICGDDLQRVDREAMAHHIAECQSPSGCFGNVRFGSEQDVRFMYSACVVCEVLGDWSGMDTARATEFLAACQRYDGGFGEGPEAEGHGGTTYCAVAALALLRRLDVINLPALLNWAVHRQQRGLAGRPNKSEDTCYSYWVGCTLAILEALPLVDVVPLVNFVLECQDQQRGGIRKDLRSGADILHTCLSIAALGLLGVPGISLIDPALGIPLRHTQALHAARQRVLRPQIENQIPEKILNQCGSTAKCDTLDA